MTMHDAPINVADDVVLIAEYQMGKTTLNFMKLNFRIYFYLKINNSQLRV